MTQPIYFIGDRILAGFLDPGTEPAELALLQVHAAVEQARSEIRYGNLERGAELLESVAREIGDLADQANQTLLALTFSVWGQGLQAWGDATAAESYFRQAVDRFTEVLGPDLADDAIADRIGSRALSDLGMALAGVGDHAGAQRVLWTGRRLGSSTPEAARRLARYAAAEGSLEQARQLLDEALPVLPTDAECWYAMAQIREQAGEDGVVDSYQQAAALWLRRGAYDQALPAIECLLTLTDNKPQVLTALAEVLRHTGRAAEAETIADDAVAAAPERFEAWLARALVYRDLNRTDDAVRDIDRALALQADEPSALVVLAHLDIDRRDVDGAFAAVRKALEIDPEHHPAQVCLAQLLMLQERYTEAREPLLAAHLANPGDTDVAILYAALASHLDDHEAVVNTLGPIWAQGGVLAPDDVANLVNALLAQNQLEDAVTVARAAYERDSNDRELQRLLASALARRAFEQATDKDVLSAAADEAVGLYPDDPDVEVLCAIVARAEERTDAAERLLEAALEKAPNHIRALAELAELLLDQGRAGDAEKWARVGMDVTSMPYFRLQAANALLKQERNSEALTLLADLPPDAGDYQADWLSLRAYAEEVLKRWQPAVDDRAAVVQLQPEDPQAWFDLAESARQAGDWEKAVSASRRVLELEPGHLMARGTLGSALALGGKKDEAVAELDEALLRDPQYVFALKERARLASTLDEALNYLSPLASISDGLDVHVQRGWAFFEHDRPSDALAEFVSALAEAPNDIGALVGASDCLTQLGRYEEATARAQRAVELDPDNVWALQTLGYVKNASGASREGLVHLRHALEMAPEDLNTVRLLAQALQNVNQVEESLTLLDEIALRRPDDPAILSMLGGHLVTLGYYDESIDPLSRSLELRPADPWVHSDLGFGLLHADAPDITAALAEFSEANRLAPGRIFLMKNLANAQHQLNMDEAEELYRSVIERAEHASPHDLYTRWNIGWCLFRLRELARAGRHLFAATAIPVDDEPARLDLGLVSLCQGKDDQALRHYESAIARLGERAPLRRRGPLRVAQVDLDIACRDWEGLNGREVTGRIREMLIEALSAVPALPQMNALGAVSIAVGADRAAGSATAHEATAAVL